MTNSFQPITKSDGKHLALWKTQQFLSFRDGGGGGSDRRGTYSCLLISKNYKS